MEGDAGAQCDDKVGGVLVAVAGGELGDDVEFGVEVKEFVAHGGVDDAADIGGAEGGVQKVGVFAQADTQVLGAGGGGEGGCEGERQ